jgi:hypothetical protein
MEKSSVMHVVNQNFDASIQNKYVKNSMPAFNYFAFSPISTLVLTIPLISMHVLFLAV